MSQKKETLLPFGLASTDLSLRQTHLVTHPANLRLRLFSFSFIFGRAVSLTQVTFRHSNFPFARIYWQWRNSYCSALPVPASLLSCPMPPCPSRTLRPKTACAWVASDPRRPYGTRWGMSPTWRPPLLHNHAVFSHMDHFIKGFVSSSAVFTYSGDLQALNLCLIIISFKTPKVVLKFNSTSHRI